MTPEEIKGQLDTLKANLEGDISKKAKAETERQIKELEDRLKAAAPKDLTTELEEAKASIKVLKDAADANQPVIDKFINGELTTKKESKHFNTLLSEGINENADKIRAMKKGQSVSFELKVVGDMTFGANFSTADVSVTNLKPGIIELPKRKLHIRELLSGGSMSLSNFAYVKETPGESGPLPVAEGTAKNQFDLDLLETSVPAEYIAVWLRISRKMLDDVQGMTTFLQSRLPELLLRAEDTQLLTGDGTSPNLSGITDAGNFTAPTGAATIDVEQLVQAIAQLEGYDREANGILLNPADYYAILLNKAAGGAGTYDLPTALATINNGQLYIAGVPVFRSTAMTADKFIVGDWVMGANLLTREAPRVEFFYEDGINVRENKVTVRVEERVAFPIYGDNYFIYGDFGNLT